MIRWALLMGMCWAVVVYAAFALNGWVRIAVGCVFLTAELMFLALAARKKGRPTAI